ncbi:MAG: glycosyltransferase [Candidatus Scalinduaceae bacterium]
MTILRKMKNNAIPESPVLLIAALKPYIGGPRICFKLFLDYIIKSSRKPFRHFDLPVLDSRDVAKLGSGSQDVAKLGKTNHFRTILGIVHALFYIPFSGSVVIFGSRNFVFFYGSLFLLSSRCLRKPCSVRFFGGRPMLTLLRHNYLVRFAVLTVFRLADAISLETELGANEFPEFLRKKIKVIFGYRPKMLEKSTTLFRDDNTIRFVYVGNVIREKGIDILLSAFCKLKDISKKQYSLELHLYGPGTQDIIYRLQKLDKVYYHGIADNLSLRKSLPSYDIFVFPSIYDNEGHPGAIIEALFAGLPVISTDLPVIREILKHGYNAILVRSGDMQCLLEAMGRLAIDQDLRQRFSQAALASCDRFDVDLVLPKLAATLGIEGN